MELIVVDDGSTDATADVAAGLLCKLVMIEKGRGPGAARNRGASEAVGTYLAFVDSDVVLPPGTLVAAAEWFDRNVDYVALVGVLSDQTRYSNVSSDYFNLRKRYDYMLLTQPIGVLYGSFCTIRADVFRASGGFSEIHDEVEDAELGMRLTASGHRIGLEHGLEVVHLKGVSLLELLRSDSRRTKKHLALLTARRGVGRAVSRVRVASFRRGAIVSAVLAPCLLLSLGAVPFFPKLWPLTAACLALFVGLNAAFLLYVLKRRGFMSSFLVGWILFLDGLAVCAGATAGMKLIVTRQRM